jgi:hypothetical protein
MKHFVLLVGALLLAALSASEAFSCSCSDFSQRDAFRKANAVFTGQFISYGVIPKDADTYPTIKFKVEKMWKGEKRSEIEIATYDLNPSVCGEGFVLGEKYLVYAYGKKLVARTVCDRSTKVEYASEDIKRLNGLWFRLSARLWPF